MPNLFESGRGFDRPRKTHFSAYAVRGLIEREPLCVRKSYRGVRGYGWSTGAWMAGMKVRTMAKDPRVAAGIVVLAVVAMLSVVLLGSDNTIAATGPKSIRGYVYDSVGTPVQDANITVRSYDSSHVLIKTLWYNFTESDGFYTVTFGNTEWSETGSFETTAVYDIYSNMNSAAATTAPFQNIDVTLGFEIPEFGAGFTATLTVASFLALVVVLVSRRSGRI